MLDDEFFISRDAKASLVSIVCPKFKEHSTEEESTRSLNELFELCRTLGLETSRPPFLQNKKTIDPATVLGSGKLQEIAEEAKAAGSTLLVFDFELTSSQIRNIKKITDLSVVDRVHIILEIFADPFTYKLVQLSKKTIFFNLFITTIGTIWYTIF